jgi:steroid delta-isomerase-like uncharacterized protein
MSTETNKAIALRLYEEVFNKGDIDALDDLAVTNYEEHDPLPGQGTGREGLRDRVSMIVSGLAPQFIVEDVIAEGDRVVVRWTNNGRHVGEFMGIPPTNRDFSIAGIDIYRLEEGKLAEHWHVIDALAQLVQLGVVTLPG